MDDSERRNRILAVLRREAGMEMSRQEARAYLIERGILTKKGKLRAAFKAEPKLVTAA